MTTRPSFTGPFAIFSVSDVERSAAFYANAFGFEETYRWPVERDQPAQFVTMALDGREIGLGISDTLSSTVELCLEVADIATAWAWLMAQGAVPLQEPEIKPWGEANAYVADPDGLKVHIYARQTSTAT